jgi:hypothetical protein
LRPSGSADSSDGQECEAAAHRRQQLQRRRSAEQVEQQPAGDDRAGDAARDVREQQGSNPPADRIQVGLHDALQDREAAAHEKSRRYDQDGREEHVKAQEVRGRGDGVGRRSKEAGDRRAKAAQAFAGVDRLIASEVAAKCAGVVREPDEHCNQAGRDQTGSGLQREEDARVSPDAPGNAVASDRAQAEVPRYIISSVPNVNAVDFIITPSVRNHTISNESARNPAKA